MIRIRNRSRANWTDITANWNCTENCPLRTKTTTTPNKKKNQAYNSGISAQLPVYFSFLLYYYRTLTCFFHSPIRPIQSSSPSQRVLYHVPDFTYYRIRIERTTSNATQARGPTYKPGNELSITGMNECLIKRKQIMQDIGHNLKAFTQEKRLHPRIWILSYC